MSCKALVLLLFPALASAANPLTWYDVATLAGGSGNAITLAWQDEAALPPDRYELLGTSIERPSQTKKWTLSKAQVQRVPAADPSKLDTSYTLKLSSGHYSFQIRACWDNPPDACSSWSNSQDPTIATVNGKPRAWWVYVFLEAPGGVIPIPASSGPTP